MDWRIIEPKENLKDFVKCYWCLESIKENTPTKNTIIPDGTIKMIFHYGDAYKHYPENGKSYLLPKCFVVGQLTKPFVVEPIGNTGTFFVRFHPNGFLPFSPIPIKNIENAIIPFNELYKTEGDNVQKKILNANSTQERIAIIEGFLYQYITSKAVIDRVVTSTVETILTAHGQIAVNELSQKYKISRRQLTRKFSSTIGLSPKQLSKTIRLQASLKTLLTKKVTRLTDLAYENEYFDQAHFIKDFKAFTGLTPKEFYGDQLKMSLIFDNKD